MSTSAQCEPEDLPPQKIYNHGCVSHENITLNYCVAKNGACSADDGTAVDYGYFVGVSALFDEFHVVRLTVALVIFLFGRLSTRT